MTAIELLRRGHLHVSSIAVLLVLFFACSLAVPNFFDLSNLTNLLRVSAILALSACGQALVIVIGGIDFSIGSSVALGSVVTVMVLQVAPMPVAFAAGFMIMVAAGLANGILIARLKLPPFLATLAMLMLLHSVAAMAVGGLPIEAPVSNAFYMIGRGDILGIPVPIILATFSIVLLHVLLSRTMLGRRFYLIGANSEAARLSGIPVERTVIIGYAVAAGFVAVAGLVLTSRVASGQPNLMPNLPFESIAACAIGGISLSGGRGSAIQVLLGVLIIAIINNAIVLLNLPAAAQLATLGIVLVVAAVSNSTDHVKLFQRLRFSRRAVDGPAAP